MGGLLHLVQRGGAWEGCGPTHATPFLAVPNVTAHPSTASVLCTNQCIAICYMMVRCSAVVAIKGLIILIRPLVHYDQSQCDLAATAT